jgi:mannose-6-phosphate isomerase
LNADAPWAARARAVAEPIEAVPLAQRLEPSYSAKPWGRTDGLPGPADAMPLGEIAFPDPGAPLLLKWIQTAEPLSVQVHPTGPSGRRKHEWWHVAEARPGAYLHLGLARPLDGRELAERAQAGTLLEVLNRIEPKPGDSFFVPAGTIHALGPGLTVVEVQEPCDVTYRLYDYGRDRPLHLDEALGVARLHPGPVKADPDERAPFRLRRLRFDRGDRCLVEASYALAAVVAGAGRFDDRRFAAAECWRLTGPVPMEATAPGLLILAEPSPPLKETRS